MSRTAIYARKSTESDDKQVLSLDAQLRWAQEMCAKVGIRDPVVFTEARSAKTPGRAVFGRLMQTIANGEIDTIVCWKADRLARNAADAGTVLFALESKQLRRIVTSDGTYADDADSELMLGILLGFSAKYSKDLSKNIRRGMDEKLRRGEWSWTAPFGYKNVRAPDGHAHIGVDEEMAPYVQQLFELAGTGAYSLNDLARMTRDVWKIHKPRRRSNSTKLGLSHTTIDHILRNPFYRGLLVVKGEVYAGSHTPLVTTEQFNAVQDSLRGRRRLASRPKTREFALAGILRCAGCGRALTGTVTKSRSGKRYTYYVCSNKTRGRCTQPLLSEQKLLGDIVGELSRLSITEAEYALAERMLAEAEHRTQKALAQQKRRAEADVQAIDAQQSRLLDLLIAGAVTEDDYEVKRRELATRRAEESIVIAAAESSLAERFKKAQRFARTLVDANSVFGQMAVGEQRVLLRALGFKIVADGRQPRLELAQPAALVAENRQLQEWWSLWDEVAKFFLGDLSLRGPSSPHQEAA